MSRARHLKIATQAQMERLRSHRRQVNRKNSATGDLISVKTLTLYSSNTTSQGPEKDSTADGNALLRRDGGFTLFRGRT